MWIASTSFEVGRAMALRPSDNEELKTLGAQVTEHKKRQFKLPVIIKCAQRGLVGIFDGKKWEKKQMVDCK